MFTATFGGKTYDETGIERMELKQARTALKLLKRGQPASKVFTEAELAESDALYKKWLAESKGKLKSTDVRIKATGMTAEEFLEQFYQMAKDQPTMLAANPEHFLIGPDLSHGIEVCGGVPVQVVMKLDDEFLKEVPPTPGYPTRMKVAKGYSRNGDFMLGALHQFRSTADGFEGILGIYYGSAIDDQNLTYHQEHLSVEYYNWYRFALERLGRKGSNGGEVPRSEIEIVAMLKARPGSEQIVQESLRGTLAPTRAEEGCIDYRMYVSATDPTAFVVIEKWRSQADLDAHRQTPHLQTSYAEVSPHLDTAPNVFIPLT